MEPTNWIDTIQRSEYVSVEKELFTILIPSWNNLPYLQKCVESISAHSAYNHQLIVIVNEGTDGTMQWTKEQQNLDWVISSSNLGICFGLNAARRLFRTEYVMYMNDDMYVLPGWDRLLKEEIERIGHKSFMLSSTLIEPHDTGNPCVIVSNYGDSMENFDQERLIREFHITDKVDWAGSTWPPNVMHLDVWDLVGGMSIEFSPGMYSDPDLSRKLYDAGVRYFKGVGKSRVYHFGSKSTGRRKVNRGRDTFILKWGITPRLFSRDYISRGESWPIASPNDFSQSISLMSRLKLIWAALKKKLK